MTATVEAHRRAGHVLVLLTSATRYLAGPLAADLGIEHMLVTQLVVAGRALHRRGRPPGLLRRREDVLGRALRRQQGIDLARSYFYTDSITDLPVLERVGEPRIVNPDPRLGRLAARRGWPIFRLRLDDTGRPSTRGDDRGEQLTRMRRGKMAKGSTRRRTAPEAGTDRPARHARGRHGGRLWSSGTSSCSRRRDRSPRMAGGEQDFASRSPGARPALHRAALASVAKKILPLLASQC
jgi:hypothetical protein